MLKHILGTFRILWRSVWPFVKAISHLSPFSSRALVYNICALLHLRASSGSLQQRWSRSSCYWHQLPIWERGDTLRPYLTCFLAVFHIFSRRALHFQWIIQKSFSCSIKYRVLNLSNLTTSLMVVQRANKQTRKTQQFQLYKLWRDVRFVLSTWSVMILQFLTLPEDLLSRAFHKTGHLILKIF